MRVRVKLYGGSRHGYTVELDVRAGDMYRFPVPSPIPIDYSANDAEWHPSLSEMKVEVYKIKRWKVVGGLPYYTGHLCPASPG